MKKLLNKPLIDYKYWFISFILLFVFFNLIGCTSTKFLTPDITNAPKNELALLSGDIKDWIIKIDGSPVSCDLLGCSDIYIKPGKHKIRHKQWKIRRKWRKSTIIRGDRYDYMKQIVRTRTPIDKLYDADAVCKVEFKAGQKYEISREFLFDMGCDTDTNVKGDPICRGCSLILDQSFSESQQLQKKCQNKCDIEYSSCEDMFLINPQDYHPPPECIDKQMLCYQGCGEPRDTLTRVRDAYTCSEVCNSIYTNGGLS